MGIGLVSGLSLASYSDSGSCLVAHTLLSQDGFQQEEFGEVVGHMVFPFDFSQSLPVGGGWLVPYQDLLCKITHAHGYCGAWPWWVVSVSVLPLTDGGLWEVSSLPLQRLCSSQVSMLMLLQGKMGGGTVVGGSMALHGS